MNKQPEALTPEETRRRRDARVERTALGTIPDLWDKLVDLYGRPSPGVRALNPGLDVKDFPRLATLKWPGSGGRWINLGPPAAAGDGVIALVEWLSAGAPRDKCVDFLEQALNELEVSAA